MEDGWFSIARRQLYVANNGTIDRFLFHVSRPAELLDLGALLVHGKMEQTGFPFEHP